MLITAFFPSFFMTPASLRPPDIRL